MRAQVIGVILFATVAEVIGSLIWGVYRYRLHNLPLFIPPAHGLVYLSGVALAAVIPARPLVAVAAVGSIGWGSPDRRCCRGSTSRVRCACRCSSRSCGGRAFARHTRGCSSSSPRSSCTGRRSVVALGHRAPGPRHRTGESAERRRERLRVVRRDGAARRTVARRRHAHGSCAARASRCLSRLRPARRWGPPSTATPADGCYQRRSNGMPIVFGVALGGALGASARYGLDRVIEQRTSSLFPWATFTINVSGCFVIGLLTAALVEKQHLPPWIRVGLVVGVVAATRPSRRLRRRHSSSARCTTSRSGSPTSPRACSSASPRSTPARSRDGRCSASAGRPSLGGHVCVGHDLSERCQTPF